MNERKTISVTTQDLMIKAGARYLSMNVRVWIPVKEPIASVFCFHELMGNGRDFDVLAAFLCANGFKVVCPDFIGRGRSAFSGDSASYDVDLFVNQIKTLEKFRSAKNYFLGVNWGGTTLLISQAVYRTVFDKLILIEPIMMGGDGLKQRLQQIVECGHKQFDSRAIAEQDVLKLLGGENLVGTQTLQHVASHRIIKKDAAYAYAFDPAIVESFQKYSEATFNLFEIADQIAIPQMLIFDHKSNLLNKSVLQHCSRNHSQRQMITTTTNAPSMLLLPSLGYIVLGFLFAA